MRKSKKSQLEFIGLAVIVLLVSIGILFAFKFVVFKQPEDPQASFEATQLSSNFINTLTETSTGCQKTTYAELLQNYFEGKWLNCGNSTNFVSGDYYLKNMTSSIINNTLALGMNYDFKISLKAYPAKTIKHQKNCNEKIAKNSVYKFFIVPSEVGDIKLELRICY